MHTSTLRGDPTVEIGGQWTHEDREQIAHALDLPDEGVRVIYPPIGGAFGGREDMSMQIVFALAVQRLWAAGIERPIRSQWSREESIVGHHKRHRGRIHARLAATSEGLILAVEADAYLDAGSYNYTSNKVLGNLHLSVAGPYEVPNARIDSCAVYTNAVPGGAFRGFGGPQGCFVSESQMNKLADALGIDPVEIRRRNALGEGSIGITGTEMPPGVSMPEVIESCADAAAWSEPLPPALPMARLRRFRRPTAPFAEAGDSRAPTRTSDSPSGSPNAPRPGSCSMDSDEAEVAEWAELYLAGAEVGQGSHTAFVQMAAEAIGMPVDSIRPTFSDTATTGDSGSASASRLTFMTGNAILGAAEEADKSWREGDRPAVGAFRYVPPPTEPLDPDGAPTTPNFAYGYVAEAVDVRVDVETGQIVVHDVVCAVDAGRVINPQLVVGQIEGAVIQAHGYALSEDLGRRQGRISNPRFSGYLIPGIGDIPEHVDSVLVEMPDPRGRSGSRAWPRCH